MKHRRWTFVIVGIWVLALVLTSVVVPARADSGGGGIGYWMSYNPTHPNGCIPLQLDCIVFIKYPD